MAYARAECPFGGGALRNIDKEGRRFTPILRPVTFLVAFGIVLMEPHRGLCAIASLKYCYKCKESNIIKEHANI